MYMGVCIGAAFEESGLSGIESGGFRSFAIDISILYYTV